MVNKYRNRKVEVDGILFDSKKEAAEYVRLKEKEKNGEISGLQRQVRIETIPKTNLYRAGYYIADFVYVDGKTGETVYEDVKGCRFGTAYQVFKLKKKLLYWRYGIDVKEV